jgi:hypothetical protein
MHLNGASVEMYVHIPNVPVIPNGGGELQGQLPD